MFRYLLLALPLASFAQAGDSTAPKTAGSEARAAAGYDRPQPDAGLIGRAEKIVAKLDLPDRTLADRIAQRVARQYAELRAIHGRRDAALKAAKEIPDPTRADASAKLALAESKAAQASLHYTLLAHLAAELDATQVEQIKDGMTYGVVPITYGVYLKMMPDLTPEQKTQIRAWLFEAREHAMDAGSSEEKHGWFGKYKGRINNYLSAAGYNLKEAEKNLRK